MSKIDGSEVKALKEKIRVLEKRLAEFVSPAQQARTLIDNVHGYALLIDRKCTEIITKETYAQGLRDEDREFLTSLVCDLVRTLER